MVDLSCVPQQPLTFFWWLNRTLTSLWKISSFSTLILVLWLEWWSMWPKPKPIRLSHSLGPVGGLNQSQWDSMVTIARASGKEIILFAELGDGGLWGVAMEFEYEASTQENGAKRWGRELVTDDLVWGPLKLCLKLDSSWLFWLSDPINCIFAQARLCF